MKRMLFNATYQEELRVATVDGQRLINFDIETSSKTQRRGNVYKGVITRVEPSLEACFVDYGVEKQGFLPFKDIDPSYLPEDARPRNFSKLKEGVTLIVQVEKDERGNKGAALTTFISLPGRYLVLMPNNSRSGGISRRIDGEERDELKSALSQVTIPEGMSVIARTAALGRVQEELQWDLDYLYNLWNAITTASNNHKGSFLIYQESSLVIRSIRDHFSPDISEILIDMEDIFEQAKQFMAHVMPNFVNRVKLYHDDIPLFSRFQIEHQIESAYGRMVNLPSGGSIAIDHTEALTAIDVNSAKSNKGSDIEATALATNLEAAEEIARQLRLRDLGGLVVVDFIDMEHMRNQREVENYFKQQLGLDRARIQMGKLSRFGLLELSRQRLQASLEESTTITCPRCSGVGAIRGIESTAIHVMRIIQEEAIKNNNALSALHVQAPVPVATYLLNEKKSDISKIEQRLKIKIVLIPNVHLESPHYRIKKITHDNYDSVVGKVSFDLVENLEDNKFGYQSSTKSNTEAKVTNVTHVAPAPIASTKLTNSILSKITKVFKTLFESKPFKPAEPNKRTGSNSGKPFNNRNQQRNNSNRVRTTAPNRLNNKSNSIKQNTNASGTSGNVQPRQINNDRSLETANRAEKVYQKSPRMQQNNTPRAENAREKLVADNPRVDRKPQQKFNSDERSLINSEWQQPDSVKPTSTPNLVTTPVKPESDKINSVTNRVVNNVETPKIHPASRPKTKSVNTIVEPIDLGNLQMVATDDKLTAKVEHHEVNIKVKRFSDQVVSEEVAAPITNYQQVETANN